MKKVSDIIAVLMKAVSGIEQEWWAPMPIQYRKTSTQTKPTGGKGNCVVTA